VVSYHVIWHKRQGARSCYNVLDRQTDTSLRAFTLAEVHKTIRDMLSNERVRNLPMPNQREDHPATMVYLAVRQVPRRLLGPPKLHERGRSSAVGSSATSASAGRRVTRRLSARSTKMARTTSRLPRRSLPHNYPRRTLSYRVHHLDASSASHRLVGYSVAPVVKRTIVQRKNSPVTNNR
jgi:hypothetical protein